MRVGICSGYFALGVHEGHLDLLNAVLEDTKENDVYGMVIVIVNNDVQTEKKYGFVPISADERCRIIEKINNKFETRISKDEDESVALTLSQVAKDLTKMNRSYPHVKISFYNSGDRNTSNINKREEIACKNWLIEMVYLDMPKRGSSSDLLKKIKERGVKEAREAGTEYLINLAEQTQANYALNEQLRKHAEEQNQKKKKRTTLAPWGFE